jgi:radical SAM superfamily enzyme YgiQ (UPF0313 family)
MAGDMKVLLISASTEKVNLPTLPLGLACVAVAIQKAGHEMTMIDLKIEEDTRPLIEEAVRGFRPEVIGLSVRNIDDQNMVHPRFLLAPVKEMVASLRGCSDATLVLGGAGYSIFPEKTLAYLGADMGIQGEGEAVFPELIARIAQGADLAGLPGLYLPGPGLRYERVFVEDLDSLPLPDPGLWSLPSQREGLWMPVQTKRGCPLDCSFCSTASIEGRDLRKHSPRVIVEWIARWRKHGVRQFYFVDNTFNLPSPHAREICRRLIDEELDIRWWNILYPKDVDEELAGLMARAGCEQVAVGFESGSERMLKSMNKKFTGQEVRQISKRLSDLGIRQVGFLLLGGPGETQESVEESLAFADSLELDSLKITAGIRVYPHTPLAKRAIGEGIISSEDDLLFPRFYLAKGLEVWLPETLKCWMAARPHWMI